MPAKICPECDQQTDKDICPRCMVATITDRRDKDQKHPLIGKILNGKYHIEDQIGKGGMGSVFRATNININQKVAIKVMHKDLVENTGQVKRFCKEAKMSSMLEHPHTVKVHDFGETEEGLLYIVMEFLKGKTLTKMLGEQRALAENRVVNIAFAIAQSLAEAHAKGIVHRDLKSDNIMVLDYIGQKDFVKVLDFGIAKFIAGESGDSSLTKTGMLVGSPHFMAPEQVRGESLDGRCDIYSLGIIMYQALCNRLPFIGETPVAVLMAQLNEKTPDFPLEIKCDKALREIILRLLSKDRNDRPAAEELISTLAEMREGTGSMGGFRAAPARQVEEPQEKTASYEMKFLKEESDLAGLPSPRQHAMGSDEKKESAGFPLPREYPIEGEEKESTWITGLMRRRRLIRRISLGIGFVIVLAGAFLFLTHTEKKESGVDEILPTHLDAFVQKDVASQTSKAAPEVKMIEPDTGAALTTPDVHEAREKAQQEHAVKKIVPEETAQKETSKPEKKKVHVKPIHIKKTPVIKQVIEKKKEFIEKEEIKDVKKIDF